MPNSLDYATWFTKQQAADLLGVSLKQIERLAKAGKLEQVLWKRPGGGQTIAVFGPDDVEREAQAQRPHVTPDALAPSNGNGHMKAETDKTDRQLSVAPSTKSSILLMMQQLSELSQQSQTIFLTIPQAAKFTGLTQAYIRRACQLGRLDALKDGGWKIRRSALVNL